MMRRWTIAVLLFTAAMTTSSIAATADAVGPIRHVIAIEKLKPGVAMPVLRARQGDSLVIDITSDRAGTLEIHGYGKEIAVQPGGTVSLSFIANRAGRFPIDLHARDGRHLEVTALEVHPK